MQTVTITPTSRAHNAIRFRWVLECARRGDWASAKLNADPGCEDCGEAHPQVSDANGLAWLCPSCLEESRYCMPTDDRERFPHPWEPSS